MTLSCDCYPGCWGDHAKDWPWVAIPRGLGHGAPAEIINPQGDLL